MYLNLECLDIMFKKEKKSYLVRVLCIFLMFFSCSSMMIEKENIYNKEYEKLKENYKYMTPEAYSLVKYNSKKEEVEKELVYSLIEFESANHRKTKYNWNKMLKVRSHSNAVGPMQLLVKYHSKTKNGKDLENPRINIYRGIKHLKWCLKISKKRYTKLAKKIYFKKYKKIKSNNHYTKFIKLFIYSESIRMYNAGTNSKRWKYPKRLWNNYVYKIINKYYKVKYQA